jgi:hypothetical protein
LENPPYVTAGIVGCLVDGEEGFIIPTFGLLTNVIFFFLYAFVCNHSNGFHNLF